MSRLFLKDLDTGLLKELGGDKVGGLFGGDIVFVDPAGAYVLLAAQRSFFESPAVLRIDLATLKSKQVAPPQAGIWSWYADPRGIVRAGLGSDADSWWLYYRERDGQSFRKIKGKRSGDMSLTNLETLIPVAGSDKGYAIANKATGRYGVYRYDFLTDTIGEPVFEHARSTSKAIVRSHRTGEPDAVRLYRRPRAHGLAGRGHAGAPGEARQGPAGPDQPGRLARRLRQPDDRPVHDRRRDPGTYYLYDRIETVDERARQAPMTPWKERRSFRSSRSAMPRATAWRIPAYLTRPAGRRERRFPSSSCPTAALRPRQMGL